MSKPIIVPCFCCAVAEQVIESVKVKKIQKSINTKYDRTCWRKTDLKKKITKKME